TIEAQLEAIANQLSPIRAGDTVDLLATVEEQIDAIAGIWRQADGELTCGQKGGGLVIPIAISRDGAYELELEFTHSGRTFHSGEFLTFPAGDADWSITLQSRGAPTPSGAAIRASYRGARIGGSSAPLPELVPNRPHRFKVS